MRRKIIIDTDPGQDDAVAILLALACPELDVLAVIAVAGNVPLHLTALNARKIVELAGRTEVPVHAGAVRPMARDLVTAEHVHGATGLDGMSLPDPTIALQPQHGVDVLVDTLLGSPAGDITLCTLGPLTDVALALVKAPEIAGRIREIVMMAGAYFEVGNITPAAEFNVYVDPEAADVVFRSGIPLTVVPLDVTHNVLNTPERLDRIRGIGNRSGRAIVDLLTFSQGFDNAKYGWPGAPLHDPNVIAYLVRPDLYEGRLVNVSIETRGALTMGMTVADFWSVTDRPKNAHFLRHANADGIYDFLIERLATLP